MQVIDRGIVFDAGRAGPAERCCAFTSLARLSDGMLLCSFNAGPAKLSATDRLILMASDNAGRTWARRFDGFDSMFEGTPGSFTAGYLSEASPDRLLIALHWVDRTDPTLPLSNPVTSGVLPMKCLLSESADRGRTWSLLREVSLLPHPGANPTGELIRLADGSWLLPYESWKDWDAVTGDQSANVKLSHDDGATWSEPTTMASDPAGRYYYWDNHVTLDPATGRLLAAFWTHDSKEGMDAPIHLAWGDPTGHTWTAPDNTMIEGQVAAPVFLEEDRLLLVYVHRNDPPAIRAVLSEDRGRTWRTDEVCVVYASSSQKQAGMGEARTEAEYWNDMARWTFGHPKVVPLDGDRVLIVFYAPPNTDALTLVPPPLCIHWALLSLKP